MYEMKELISLLERLRIKLEPMRKKSLKETPTRTIFINPILEALGWDVHDPDVVEEEYPTVDGKSVDYALKINQKPVLLIEAKPLNDSLEDVKAITQVVSYANNGGIDWCVLTNGIRWRIYNSREKRPAPEKLLYEVSYDPNDSGETPLSKIAEKLWRLSREEMAKGTLDAFGEQKFTDSKVKKALEEIIIEPPRTFINLLRGKIGDKKLPPKTIKKSLARVWKELQMPATLPAQEPQSTPQKSTPDRYYSATSRAVLSDEKQHTKGKPQKIIELYGEIKDFCLKLAPQDVSVRYTKKYVVFAFRKSIFCTLSLSKKRPRVWLKLKYQSKVRS